MSDMETKTENDKGADQNSVSRMSTISVKYCLICGSAWRCRTRRFIRLFFSAVAYECCSYMSCMWSGIVVLKDDAVNVHYGDNGLL